MPPGPVHVTVCLHSLLLSGRAYAASPWAPLRHLLHTRHDKLLTGECATLCVIVPLLQQAGCTGGMNGAQAVVRAGRVYAWRNSRAQQLGNGRGNKGWYEDRM